MTLKNLLALCALTAFGCGNEELTSRPGAEVEAEAPDSDSGEGDADTDATPEFAAAQSGLTSSGADYYHCFTAGGCSAPALSNSTTCLKGRDYDTAIDELRSDVVVLSIHGGLIEPNSTELASAIADRFGWSRYNFSAHGSSACLRGLSNFGRLHITAPIFDDPAAVGLVARHKKALAIHGYNNSRGNYRGAICVGGAGADLVQKFIASVNQNKSKFTQYTLKAVNAAAGLSSTGADCSGLTGTARANPVNRVSGSGGGLQLEMSDGIKADLLNPNSKYNGLRTVIYGAIGDALES